MFSVSRVPDDILAKWRELARQTSDALNYAGVPAYLVEEVQDRPGAEITIDAGDDEAGGVFVTWRPSDRLLEGVLEDTMKGLRSTSSHNIFIFTTVAACMQNAIVGILWNSGLDAVPFNDDALGPPAVHVLGPVAGAQ
jgi:hypothetical protein